MSEEQKTVPKAQKSRIIKKLPKISKNPEADKHFDDLRRKYANSVAYLLIKNVKQSELRDYFEKSEDNKKRYQSVKKFRQDIIDARPKAKQWVDKPFYIGLKLGQFDSAGDQPCVSIILGECAFKQPTSVVANRWELEGYMDTISKIIESERIWADPDMADFDVGERDDISTKYLKKREPKPAQAASVAAVPNTIELSSGDEQ